MKRLRERVLGGERESFLERENKEKKKPPLFDDFDSCILAKRTRMRKRLIEFDWSPVGCYR